mgnify:FL=1
MEKIYVFVARDWEGKKVYKAHGILAKPPWHTYWPPLSYYTLRVLRGHPSPLLRLLYVFDGGDAYVVAQIPLPKGSSYVMVYSKPRSPY